MNDAAAIVAEAGALLTELERTLHAHGEQISELREAGVSTQRIDSLYPHDLDDWEDGLLRCGRAADWGFEHPLTTAEWKATEALAQQFKPSSPILSEADCETYRWWTRGVDTCFSTPHVMIIAMVLRLLVHQREAQCALTESNFPQAQALLARTRTVLNTIPIGFQPRPKRRKKPSLSRVLESIYS